MGLENLSDKNIREFFFEFECELGQLKRQMKLLFSLLPCQKR